MFLHVGNNKNIREKDIIGIFDTDNATVSSVTRRYLSEAEKDDFTESATEELPKSFILYANPETDFAERGKFKVCFSQLSSTALVGRQQSFLKHKE